MWDLVAITQGIKIKAAMICRKKAMDTGGSSVKTIFVLIKEYPQKITVATMNIIDRRIGRDWFRDNDKLICSLMII